MDPGPMGPRNKRMTLGQVVKHPRHLDPYGVVKSPFFVGQISIMVGISELLSLS